jgi:small-conductance mechanosensitive channel
LRGPFFQEIRAVLTATWQARSFKISLGDILAFAVTIWAAVLFSRMLRFLLDEEVYPRVQLAPGLDYSISKMVNYAILLLGFLIGVTMLGFDLTHLTILVSAFGVGVGFGLQNIVNNFVSGIILLFERPIKIGDVVQISAGEGVVTRIGIRASIVRLGNGAEIIVPNASFISDPVINWTLSNRLRRIDLTFAVEAGAEPRQVMDVLKAAAQAQPRVSKDPPPEALLAGFDGGSLTFELRAWTDQPQDWSTIRSDLALAARVALARRDIAVK